MNAKNPVYLETLLALAEKNEPPHQIYLTSTTVAVNHRIRVLGHFSIRFVTKWERKYGLSQRLPLIFTTVVLVLRVLVTAASVGEREGGKQVLKKVKQMSKQVSRLTTL
jgi:hypothetical protein